jgi:serine/threonine-protein kinase
METMLSTAGTPALVPGDVSDLLLPGVKAGPWIVERELGRGGMGAVYAVVHEEIGKRAALKVVHGRLLGGGFNPDRMLIEARVVNQVGHPNIVDIFETGKLPDGRPYIVMERLEGQSLAHRVDSGSLDAELAIAILHQICDALIAAHASGIVHRDLKLDNVFLIDNLDEPNTPKVKILDWGIAKIIHHDVHHTVEGQLVGTPQYLAPEQARGARVSSKTDVYSLGVMAYELFLDQLPFEAETSAEIMAMHLRATPPPPRDLWPEIPWQLEELLLEMLAKNADDRPSMLEVAHRLEDVRLEIERRRRENEAANASVPPSPSASVASPLPEVPRTARRMSADAHAATRPADWRVRLQHWRYAVGGLAILGCIALFLMSRSGDQVASAAAPPTEVSDVRDHRDPPPSDPAPAALDARTASDARAELDPPVAIASAPEATGATLTVAAQAPAARPELARPAGEPALLTAASPRTDAVHQAVQVRSVTAVRPAATAAARTPGRTDPANRLHRAPAAPRRAAKIDPDGTLDPYR